MAELIEHSASRALGYAIVAVLALLVWRRGRGDDAAWSSFWWFTAGLVGLMAVARLVDVGDVMTDIGRERVRDAGWYESRRAIQASVAVAGAAIGVIVAAIVIARVPRRWSHFLPVVTAVTALVAFAILRLLSLHHVENVIHDRRVGAVRVGTVVEYALVVAAGLTVARHLRGVRPGDRG